jgi:hypothetical protein
LALPVKEFACARTKRKCFDVQKAKNPIADKIDFKYGHSVGKALSEDELSKTSFGEFYEVNFPNFGFFDFLIEKLERFIGFFDFLIEKLERFNDVKTI